MRHFVRAGLVACLFVATTVAQATTVTFEPSALSPRLYEPWEVAIRVTNPLAINPFDVNITGTFTPQGSTPVTVHGFCDSQDGTLFKVRFTPSKQVSHSYSITYQDPGLTQSTTGTISVSWSANPGFIRTDRRFPGHFVDERTGRHWFHHGCTPLAMLAASEFVALNYIDYITSLGFNRGRIFLCAGIRPNLLDQVINPFLGTDYTRFDVAFWQRVERLIAHMRKKNLIADVNFETDWGGFTWNFADRNSITTNEWRYYRYAIDRLSHFTNLTWNLGNEYPEYHSTTWANNMGARVKSYDPYQHLLTAHPSGATFNHATSPWADTIDLQAYSGGSAITPRTNWQALRMAIDNYRNFGKPVVNDEYGYEFPYPADIEQKSHWTNVFCGAYATYGANAAISIRGSDQELIGPEIVDDRLQTLLGFIKGTDWWIFNYDPGVIIATERGAFARAIRGHEYGIYLPDGGNVTVNLAEAQGRSLPVEWINPTTGQVVPAPPTAGAASLFTVPPFAGDALLHIGKLTRNEPIRFDFSDPTHIKSFKAQSGRWVNPQGLLYQRDPSTTGITTLVGRTYDDVQVDFDLALNDPMNNRAGIQLRRWRPTDILSRSGVRVTYFGDGRVKIHEAKGDGTVVQLAEGQATTWNIRDYNHCSVLVRGNRVIAYGNNGERIASGAIRFDNLQAGYVSLFTQTVRAVFDNLKTRPIFYRTFQDGLMDGIVPISGNWKLGSERLVQDLPSGGGVGLATAPIENVSLDLKMRVIDNRFATDTGFAFRVASLTEPFGQSGYFLRFDQHSHVELIANDPVNGPAILATYDDPPEAPILVPGDWNIFNVQAIGSHFVITANTLPMMDVIDPAARYSTGYVQLWSEGPVRYDDIALKEAQ